MSRSHRRATARDSRCTVAGPIIILYDIQWHNNELKLTLYWCEKEWLTVLPLCFWSYFVGINTVFKMFLVIFKFFKGVVPRR